NKAAQPNPFGESTFTRRKRLWEALTRAVFGAMAAAMIVPLLTILTYLVVRAWPALSWEFLVDVPKNNMTEGGIWPAYVGTLYLVGLSLAVSAPIGVLAAIYLNEYASDNWFNRLVNLAVKTATQKAEERGVSLHAVIDDHLPLVQADPEKIAWVVNQLLDNGIKFTPSGGRVVISLRKEGDHLVVVSVTDTGIGIPASKMDEIFEPFHQLDGSTTRRSGGTGLGLSLVRQIVEAHGSLLEVKSIEGRGSTFQFPLLAVKEAAH
ncbi:MAG: ATP-binding protein, partial [Anaerolineae bacterium]